MDETIDKNWYSPESVRHDREKAEQVLKQMQDLEKKFKKTRNTITEKTLCGERIKYVKR